MAISCVSCGRANADTASACLYCGDEVTPRSELPPGRRTNPHHVAWLPSADPARDAARLEALLQVEAYQATLLVRGGGPRILRTLGDPSEARDLHESAAQMGLRTFVVDDHTLDTHPPVAAVERAAVGPGGIEVSGSRGSLRPGEARLDLLVAGRVLVRRQRTQARVTVMSAEPGATPGLPRMVRRTSSTSDRHGVLDLYPAGEPICWRVREEATDFAGIEADGPASALLRFTRLVEEVRRSAPDAPFDDRFDRFDDGDLSRAERRQVRNSVVVLDGIARFGRHSRLAWLALRVP